MKIVRHCLMLALLAIPLSAPAAEPEEIRSVTINKIAAVVNGEIITLHELRQNAGSELMRAGVNPSDPAARGQVDHIMSRVLSVMIDDILLRQEAERLQVKVTDAEVDNELNRIVQRNQTTLRDFEAQLAAQGATLDLMKARIRNSLLSQRIISFQISRRTMINGDEIREYYEAHRNDFQADRSVDVSLIVFAPAANAEDIHKKIMAGTLSFENAARQYSEGPAPDNGGRIGLIPWEDLALPIKAQVMHLANGEVSALFLIEGRDCLVKLNESTPGRSMSLEEATPEIERILREPRLQQRFTEYTRELRSRAVIDIRL